MLPVFPALLRSTTDDIVGLALAIGVIAYLVFVLIFPERF